jgi:two-component system sensor histidine kinase RegB
VVALSSDGVETLTVPRQDLVEALVPLLQNALYATSNDGPVALEVAREDGHLRFAVRDGGAGMDAETLSRASEPFYTTKPPGEGTGLGLHHVRLVAERLGGKLELDSKEGEGTVATLTFPEPRSP